MKDKIKIKKIANECIEANIIFRRSKHDIKSVSDKIQGLLYLFHVFSG